MLRIQILSNLSELYFAIEDRLNSIRRSQSRIIEFYYDKTMSGFLTILLLEGCIKSF